MIPKKGKKNTSQARNIQRRYPKQKTSLRVVFTATNEGEKTLSPVDCQLASPIKFSSPNWNTP